jgi:type I restriction enzyme S subunit
VTSTNWHETTFGELIEIKHGFAFKGEFFGEAGEHIVLTPGNFHEHGGMKLKGAKEKFYTDVPPDEYVLNRGDLIVAMTDLVQNAPILGSSAFVPESGKYLHNQRLGKITVKRPDLVSPEFIFWLFNSYSVRGQIKGSATGATVRHTSPSRIYEVSVELPPLPTQRKIASILSAYDDLIENNTRRIAVLEEMAQSIYREWFVNFRFPGFEDVKLVDSPLGQIPEGWRAGTISDVAVNGKKGVAGGPFGSNLGRKDYVTEGVPVIRGANLSLNGRFSDDEFVYVSEEKAAALKPNQATRGDIVVTQRGTLGQVGMIPMRSQYETFIISQSQMKISVEHDKCDSLYLLHLLRSPVAVSRIKNHAISSGVPHINLTMLRKFTVLLPPREIQRLYVDHLRPSEELIELLSRKDRNLRTTRDLLLPKLISGKLDVEDLDIDVGEPLEELEEATV